MAKLLFSFNGRAGRLPFWLFQLVASVILLPIYIWEGDCCGIHCYSCMAGLLLLWPGAAIQVKRWHDRDKSAWWLLMNIVPFIGYPWVLVECGFLRGTVGQNRFGPDPLGGVEFPPILVGAKVLEYAVVDTTLSNTGIGLYVGNEKMEPVRLAICQKTDASPEVFLYHCDAKWNVLSAAAYGSVEAAKEAAAAEYDVISSKWVKPPDAPAPSWTPKPWPGSGLGQSR